MNIAASNETRSTLRWSSAWLDTSIIAYCADAFTISASIDCNSIGPGVVFTNDRHPRSPRFEPVRPKYASKGWLSPTTVGRGAAIGANATIGSGLTIGEFAMVGAAANVTADVPAHALVLGNPARVRGYVCACGQRLRFRGAAATCAGCGCRYRKDRKGVCARG